MHKNLIDKEISKIFQALAHPIRLEILELFRKERVMCVCEIVGKLKKEQSVISRHLNTLKLAGILDYEEKGVRSFYKVKNDSVYKILGIAKDILFKELEAQRKITEKI
ncbi:MAG: metalloregulator ArsR/SmtB family transcription factor [Candidatus Omnitrophica bacterium]|nr:metalloregulator ArsR/SmtB family transcription factor [Candidatus Omnitrophota bacterium]